MDRSREGLDHHFSLLPDELVDLVKQLRNIEQSLRGTEKAPADREAIERFWVRRGLWLKRSVRAGELLLRSHLDVVRPQAGAPAAELDKLIGRTLRRDLMAGSPVNTDDLE